MDDGWARHRACRNAQQLGIGFTWNIDMAQSRHLTKNESTNLSGIR